jgi:signal transduction histidine kinase
MQDFLLHIPGRHAELLNQAKPELRVGRAPGQDIILEDPAISRSHARFLWKGGKAYLEDLGSRHGSHVNGRKASGRCEIHPGDLILLGEVAIALTPFEPGEAPNPGPGAPRRLREETVTLSLPVESLRLEAGRAGAAAGSGPSAMDILHHLSRDLVSRRSPRSLLKELLERLMSHLDAGHGAVFLRHPGGPLECLAETSRGIHRGEAAALSPGTMEALFDRKEALLMDAPPQAPDGLTAPTPGDTTRSVMVVPLEAQGEVFGLMHFSASETRGPFTEQEIRFVVSLGNLAATRIIHQRTAEELQRKEELERQILGLESQTRAKGELLALISHEIRSPLTALLGYLELAQRGDLPPATQAHLQKAGRSGNALLNILNDVLDFSKLEAGGVELERIPFQLQEVLETVLDLFGSQATAKGIALQLQRDPSLPSSCVGDPLRLGQVLTNLVGNAVKFTTAGHVSLVVAPEEDPARLRFIVEDTGIGIPEERLDHLFQPYAQGEAATTRRYGGTGLGLYISSRLVEMQGGAITVASEPGQGSVFAFSLPLLSSGS